MGAVWAGRVLEKQQYKSEQVLSLVLILAGSSYQSSLSPLQ